MKAQTKIFFIGLLGLLIFSRLAFALPSAPGITYVANSSAVSGLVNRSTDAQGTITTIQLSANQQDYKWKAYVGNVSGKVALDNANGQSIYDWNLGTAGGGEVYVSRFSNISWNSIVCANAASIAVEHAGLGISGSSADSINATFNYTNHKPWTVATNPVLNGCRSTATYISDAPQTMTSSAYFQEILIMDGNGYMAYSTSIESAHTGFDVQPHDFQLLVAENESATVPTTYFFWVELG
jgi:hypothetical protein